MMLVLLSDDGEVLNTWENIEDWDLAKGIAAGVLAEEIREEIEKAKKTGKS